MVFFNEGVSISILELKTRFFLKQLKTWSDTNLNQALGQSH